MSFHHHPTAITTPKKPIIAQYAKQTVIMRSTSPRADFAHLTYEHPHKNPPIPNDKNIIVNPIVTIIYTLISLPL